MDLHLQSCLQRFAALPRRKKRVVTVAIDFAMLFGACWLAFALRLGEAVFDSLDFWQASFIAPLASIPIMVKMGLYRAVIRYIGYRALWTCAKAVTLSVILWSLLLVLFDIDVPRSVMIIYWFTSMVAVGGSRMFGRWVIRQVTPISTRNKSQNAERVIIYGAGASGRQAALAMNHGHELYPVAFIDDDTSLHGMEVSGLRVHSADELSDLVRSRDAESVLIAISSLPRTRRLEIVHFLESFGVRVLTIPALSELAQGKVQISDIREVDVTDLLGREAVAPNQALLSACIEDKSVLVTGAGGSIGSELCRQIIKQEPRRLVLFELTEFALYSIDKELSDLITQSDLMIDLVPVIGTIQDREHLVSVMKHYETDTVYHAAAYKHVPLVEHNVISGLRNNVFGTWNTAEAAVSAGVENFVLVSTDKAVRPTNVMGGTKRLAELVLQGMSLREDAKGNDIRFAMVRFGNVLGSSGSVIPLFKKQIAKGGPVTVTHPEITRYFMTIPEAAALVIQAGSMGHSGDVFVLDMGQPVKIVDLAKEMVRLAGLSVKDDDSPAGDIEIAFTGLRPGEKLYEELLIGGAVSGTDHKMIMRASEMSLSWDEMETVLAKLDKAISKRDYPAIREMMLTNVNGYEPKDEIVDWLYQQSVSALEPVEETVRS